MTRKLILAHDLGTSGDKACLFDVNGSFVAEAYYKYKTYYPAEGYAEHNPRDWWEAVKASTQEVVRKAKAHPKEVQAISFSAHGMGAIPVDHEGNLLVERVMVWMDARSTKEARHILEKVGDREHYEITGNSFDLALYPAAKILWLRKNMPDVYKKTYKFLSTKEYLIHKMTGNIRYTDYGEAGMSGLYNLNTHQWDPELLEVSEVDQNKLLEPCDSTQIVGELTNQAAKEMGLAAGTAVVQGSWDNYACGTGGGVQVKGKMVVCIGTAAWMGINSEKPLMDKNFMSNVVYVGNDTYFTTTHSHSACVANDWVLNNLCTNLMESKEGFTLAQKLAKEIEPGSNKLFFMPSMFSGNTFYSDAALCGSFVGLKTIHTQAHIIRSAMEGIGFDLMMGSEFFKSLGVLPTNSSIIGGGANNKVWCEILASMTNMNMTRPKNQQHIGALGAALMAGVGTGLINDFDVANSILEPEAEFTPSDEWIEKYEKLLPVYKNFYEQLLPAYKNYTTLKSDFKIEVLLDECKKNTKMTGQGIVKTTWQSVSSQDELGIFIALVILCLIINFLNPIFFSTENILNVLRQISNTSIIAVGMAFVLITGGIDLSVGSTLCFGAVLCATLTNFGLNGFLALIITLIATGLIGSVTAFIIVKLKIVPFIVTMAMQYIVRGIAYLITSGSPIPFNTNLNFLGSRVGNVPVPAIMMFVILIIGHIILSYTIFGKNLFAVGGNENAAKLSGIKVEKIKFVTYIIIAVLSAFAGIMSAANTSSAASNMGTGQEMDAIAAAVIGGCSLSGGKGSIGGVIIGAAILGVIRNGFVLLTIPSSWQSITIGVVLVIASILDQIQSGRRNRVG